MKTIIAGSRSITDYKLVSRAINMFLDDLGVTEVVSGCANGVDTLGERWAKENSVPVARFPAEWNKYGRGAGPIRNKEMAEYADALILIWDGQSKGSKNMLDVANKNGLRVFNCQIK